MMSSCSSEVDVVKTRITTCDDDNGLLYAYESKAEYAHQENVQPATSGEEQQKTIVDILNRCKIIQDAIESLEKKFKTVQGKVSKLYRFRTKLIWQHRKPLGYAYKHYTYLLSRKIRKAKASKKKKKIDLTFPASFSCTESYSPTTPVKRPRDDSQSNVVGTYCPSQDSLIHGNDDQEIRLSQSPTFPPVYTQEDTSYYPPDEPMHRSPFLPSFGNPGSHSSPGAYSPTQPSIALPESVLEKAACSSFGIVSCMLTHDFPRDPSTWTVEEVILFLQRIDPETFIPIANTFRQHDIDGIALLLLQSEVMIKYMGIKLGTALKLCHYVEKLKAERGVRV